MCIYEVRGSAKKGKDEKEKEGREADERKREYLAGKIKCTRKLRRKRRRRKQRREGMPGEGKRRQTAMEKETV